MVNGNEIYEEICRLLNCNVGTAIHAITKLQDREHMLVDENARLREVLNAVIAMRDEPQPVEWHTTMRLVSNLNKAVDAALVQTAI